MTETFYDKTQHILFVHHFGAFLPEEVEILEDAMMHITEPVTLVVELSTAKIVDRSIVTRMANFSKKHKHLYKHVYLIGMKGFILLMSRLYFQVVGKEGHTLVEGSLEHFSESHNIQLPSNFFHTKIS